MTTPRTRRTDTTDDTESADADLTDGDATAPTPDTPAAETKTDTPELPVGAVVPDGEEFNAAKHAPYPVCKGAVHPIVDHVQAALGVTQTGVMDKATVAAVKQLQRDAGLPVTGRFGVPEIEQLTAARELGDKLTAALG